MTENFDNDVRVALFREFVRTGEPPTTASLAVQLQTSADDVRSASKTCRNAAPWIPKPQGQFRSCAPDRESGGLFPHPYPWPSRIAQPIPNNATMKQPKQYRP